jgi:hypothetical protein
MTNASMGVRWVSQLCVDGEIAFRVGRDGEMLVAEWTGLGILRADRAGRAPSFVWDPRANPKLVNKVKNGHAAALVRHLQGSLSLHASVVARRGLAVAFVGPSGAGKSTLDAALCARADYELMADDIAPVQFAGDEVLALPGEREHWLDEASVEALSLGAEQAEQGSVGEKCALPATRIASQAARLVAVVSLVFEAERPVAQVSRLRGLAALEPLVPCVARFVIDEARVQEEELAQLSALCARVPILELRRARRLSDVRSIGEELEKLFEPGRPDGDR